MTPPLVKNPQPGMVLLLSLIPGIVEIRQLRLNGVETPVKPPSVVFGIVAHATVAPSKSAPLSVVLLRFAAVRSAQPKSAFVRFEGWKFAELKVVAVKVGIRQYAPLKRCIFPMHSSCAPICEIPIVHVVVVHHNAVQVIVCTITAALLKLLKGEAVDGPSGTYPHYL